MTTELLHPAPEAAVDSDRLAETVLAPVPLPNGVSGLLVWMGTLLPLHDGPQTVALG